MTVTTATITVGTSHPNGEGVCATHVIRVVEHMSMRLVVHDLAANRTEVVRVGSPHALYETLWEAIDTYVAGPAGAPPVPGDPGQPAEYPGMALFVAVSPGSSLESDLDRFKALRHTEVCIAAPVWRRHQTQWSTDWHIDDWGRGDRSGPGAPGGR